MMLWLGPQVSSSSPRSAQAAVSASPSSPAGSRVSRSLTISTPIMRPGPRTSPMRGSSAASACRPRVSSAPRSAALATRPSSRMTSRTAMPAAQETGLPPYVEPCAPTPQRCLEVARGDEGRQRQAVGDGLGRQHDVGHDAGVLEGPHAPGAAVARLDLVGDEQDAVPVGQLAQAAQEGSRGGHVAALALHRLDDEGGRARRRHDRGEEPLEVVQGGGAGGLLVAPEVAVGVRERRDVDVRQQRVVAGAVVEAGGGDADARRRCGRGRRR